jgi:hypothetical protein
MVLAAFLVETEQTSEFVELALMSVNQQLKKIPK